VQECGGTRVQGARVHECTWCNLVCTLCTLHLCTSSPTAPSTCSPPGVPFLS
jgi:hypothetical protein